MRILVTGSNGFLGQRVVALLEDRGHEPVGADLDHSVLSSGFAADVDVAIHLAAHKHAAHGEEFPAEVAELNIQGTANVVRTAPRVVLASTCKAAAPVTCYGASKLIAERIVLNAGGTVVRLVNVLGSSGSVTEIWGRLPADVPLPVTETERMFVTPENAARMLVDAVEFPAGRYGPRDPEWFTLKRLAGELYPGRPQVRMSLRRGDRPIEQLTNQYETTVPFNDSFVRVFDRWESREVSHRAAA